MLKNRIKVDAAYARTQSIKAAYETRFFTDVLKVPEEKIDDFMYFCEVDPKFESVVKTNDYLTIWEFLRAKSKTYRANNELD